MMPPAPFTDIPRHRVEVSLDLGVAAWLDHCITTGLVGSPGHGFDRAIQRLRLETSCLTDRCKQAGTKFRFPAFWALYQQEIALALPGGKARMGQVPGRGRISGTMAIQNITWAEKACIEDGPFDTLSQVIEVGLRSLRQGGTNPSRVGQSEGWKPDQA